MSAAATAEFNASMTSTEPIPLHVVDVGSLYGNYVNRERVESAMLANGDKIYLGIFCLVVLKSRND